MDVAPPSIPDWPLFGWTDDVRPALAKAREHVRVCVLATLHSVVGGSPRPVSAQMVVDGADLHGFLSGGCIEGDIAARAQEVARTGQPQRLVYGEGGPFADIRLVCGGRVDILLEGIAPQDAAVGGLLEAYIARRPVLWASDGQARLCVADPLPSPLDAPAGLDAALAGLASPETACVSVDGGAAVALRYAPRPRVVVVGHDPVALAITSFAAQSGFETHLVRPKGPAGPSPLQNVTYHRTSASEALAAIGLDAWSYVAAATHGLEEDEEALAVALPSAAAYVGAVGARRRLPERLARLRARGVSPEVLARLHAPIGLDIGGKAPFEIAISVLAEITAELNRRRAQAGRTLTLAEAAAA